MKPRMLFVLCTVMLFTASLTLAQTKDDCAGQASTAKKSGKGCCMSGAKASLTSDTKPAQNTEATTVLVSDSKTATKVSDHCAEGVKSATASHCPMKGVKATAECTEAEKAHCEMMKTGNMSMKTKDGKVDCCKDKAKASEAKNSSKKSSQEKVADAKGTN